MDYKSAEETVAVLYCSKRTSPVPAVHTVYIIKSNQIHRRDLFRSSTIPIEPSSPRQMCLPQMVPIRTHGQRHATSSAMDGTVSVARPIHFSKRARQKAIVDGRPVAEATKATCVSVCGAAGYPCAIDFGE
jgi:hypothetical protein